MRLGVNANGQLSVKAPKGGLTPVLRQLITDNKAALVSLLREHGAPMRLSVEQRSVPLPLSSGQQRLWFLDRYSPGEARYSISAAVRLQGATLNVGLLQQAVDALFERHEILRTTFIEVGGEPRQRVHLKSAQPIAVIDLQTWAPTARIAQLDATLESEANQPFDLAHGPLLRVGLVHLEPCEHVLYFNIHHIVADDWSMALLVQEVADFYARGLAGGPAEPLPLALQYIDYAVWQRRQVQSGFLTSQVEYWRGQLAGAPELLSLPTDRSRPAVQTYRGASLPFRLKSHLVARLTAIAQSRGATLFMVLHTAFCVLLHRYSGQSDVCIGVPVAGRGRVEFEPLIGFFVNTLVLRTRIEPLANFSELLEQVKITALQAYQCQDVPFEQLVSELKLPRNLSHSPLFQVMLVMQSATRGAINIPGLRVAPLDVPVQVSKYDLTCTFLPNSQQGDMLGSMEYNTDLFDDVTVDRLLRHFQALLQDIVERPDVAVHQLRMLSHDEVQQTLYRWNDTQAPLTQSLLVHQQFERQALRTPEKCATLHGDKALSYRELEIYSRQLAHMLTQHGVGAGTRVAVLLERGLDIPIALLGILRAGAAYVPLDPSHPIERISFMLGDCGPQVLLAGENTLRDLPLLAGCARLDPCAWYGPDVPVPAKESLPEVSERGLAYVIYTSGSTGMPKGVMVEHRNLVNLLRAMQRRIPLCAEDTFLSVTTLSFDIAALELFHPLIHGALLLLASRQTAADPQSLARTVDHHDVTVMQATPSTWRMFAEHGWPLRRLKILSGGEALSAGLRQNLLEYAGSFWNLYGPTETTIWSTCHRFDTADEVDAVIGVPIDNTQVYVLGPFGELLPVGVVGEIHIGGAGVSCGYLNRPALTAQRFVPDPYGAMQGGRLYRTGDLGAWRADGTLEYAGRCDFQVKIRGARIELGEIESALARHEQVRQVVVDARPDAEGNQRLVAYVVPRQADQSGLIAALRTHLRATLAEHMLPSVLVFLEALPLTANGKIDRKALPAPDRVVSTASHDTAPRSEFEQVLVDVWSDLLGLEQVGRTDNFFEIGGHSLLAVSMVAKLRKYGLELDIHSIFASPRLADMADVLREAGSVHVPENLITAETSRIIPEMLPLIALSQEDIDSLVSQVPQGCSNIQDIYALSPMQDGILFHHLLAPEGDPYVMVFELAFAERTLLDRYLENVERVIQRHDILRTSIHWRDLPAPVQVVWRHAPLRTTLVELTSRNGPVLEQLRERLDPRKHLLDITQAGLLRVAVAEDPGEGRWLLHMRLHHLIGDHVTLQMLNDEVVSLLADPHCSLPPVRHYREFVAHTYLGPVVGRHERFFRDYLQPIVRPSLPFEIAQVSPEHLQEHRQWVPKPLLERLSHHARRLGVSLSSLCHLAWGLVVARTSRSPYAVFGTVLLGRASSSAFDEQAMGLLINTLPFCLELKGISVDDAVRNAHASLALLLRHEHAPLTLAQRCSSLPATAPLFSALLNYRRNLANFADPDPLPAGVQWLGGRVGVTYPFCMTVEAFDDAMELIAHVGAPIPAQRMGNYMLRSLHALADRMDDGPQSMIDSVDILVFDEHRQLSPAGNETAMPTPAGDLVQLFEAQVARTPLAPAVSHGERQLSYAQL
ncbi:non-ribosomal peptide synthetase, partial [Pseudomonas mosselii]|uniref:non-ribosomal peptide synthetase n=1 Tax=Pseudomonas mosselii TaxID=78327 RepID=UPI000D8BFD34